MKSIASREVHWRIYLILQRTTVGMLLLLIVSVGVFSSLSLCDVTDIVTPAGTCLRVDAGVNFRDAACGGVLGGADVGDFYVAMGDNQECSLDGILYDYHALNYNGQTGWIAGDYLNLDRTANCGTVSAPDTEWRAMWIATVYNIDWPGSPTDTTEQQIQDLTDYLNLSQALNFNAVVFQVRPVGDALYSSTIEPWSRYLTGTQGVPPDPFYDPLTFICNEAHARGIEVHVWLNPYRANMSPNTDGLAFNHVANVYPQYAYPYGSYLWMDPGADVIIDHLLDVIEDIVSRFDVDGVHFDDYFYPYPVDGTDFPDDATYNDYIGGGGTLSRADWRRDNVNRMVQRCWILISELNTSLQKNVKFSISPFGIYRPGHPDGMPSPIAGLDPYEQLYADARLWVESGWMDFLVPQLYWQTHPPAQSYPTLLDWWCDVGSLSGVQIYAGNGLYRLDSGEGDWPVGEFGVQVDISRALRGKLSLGNCQYSAKYIRDDVKGVRSLFQELYPNQAQVPYRSK